jgi:hypothetical protein
MEGMTYHIQVTGYDPLEFGPFTIQVTGVGSRQTLVKMDSPGKKQADKLHSLKT